MIDFLGIGAKKAGTTWQRHWLSVHPDIFLPPQELHFWNGRLGPAIRDYEALYESATAGQVKGDITPRYATLPRETLLRIREYNPAMRQFYCLRNPIDQMWANIRMGHDQGRLDLETMSAHEIIGYMERPMWVQQIAYSENIARWQDTFGAQALHVFLFDDLVEAPLETLAALAGHVGADPEYFASLPDDTISQMRSPIFASDAIAIPPQVLAYLRTTYAAPVAALGREMGRDLAHWIEAPTCVSMTKG